MQPTMAREGPVLAQTEQVELQQGYPVIEKELEPELELEMVRLESQPVETEATD